MSDVDPRLVQQRIRNRIFEYFGAVAEYPANRGAWNLNNLVNEWQMHVTDPFVPANFPIPPFTPAEVAELARVHLAWKDFADATDNSNVDDEYSLQLPEWSSFVAACRRAEEVLAGRGRLSEEALVANDV